MIAIVTLQGRPQIVHRNVIALRGYNDRFEIEVAHYPHAFVYCMCGIELREDKVKDAPESLGSYMLGRD